jgi:hypothetical protein
VKTWGFAILVGALLFAAALLLSDTFSPDWMTPGNL